MENERLKNIVANNIANFRKTHGLTQAELAEKLNYSDKSISKWERAEGFPDIFTLKELADFFGVKVGDFFLEKPTIKRHRQIKKEILLPLLSIGIAWLIAAILFAVLVIFFYHKVPHSWLVFIYTIVVSGIILTVFEAIHKHKLAVLLGETIIIWGVALTIFLTAICFANTNGVWLVFVVCGVVQVLAILFFLLRNDKNYFKKLFHKKHKEEDEENK